jgi:hypothetical protein
LPLFAHRTNVAAIYDCVARSMTLYVNGTMENAFVDTTSPAVPDELVYDVTQSDWFIGNQFEGLIGNRRKERKPLNS